MVKKRTLLTVSAHADDAHVALGGTIKRFLDEGTYDIHYLAFSIAEESVPKGFPKNVVMNECRDGLAKLGVEKDKLKIFKFPVRRMDEHRQDILEELVKIKNELQPDIVFIPSTEDIHQDHIVVCHESIRAFRRSSSIYGYDFPWNVLLGEKLNLFIELKKSHLDAKINSLSYYESQIAKQNNCLKREYIQSLAIERGNRIGVRYAEAFEVIRDIKRI
jgi:LmbE family N-acetylglucosaminyl deacetylase